MCRPPPGTRGLLRALRRRGGTSIRRPGRHLVISCWGCCGARLPAGALRCLHVSAISAPASLHPAQRLLEKRSSRRRSVGAAMADEAPERYAAFIGVFGRVTYHSCGCCRHEYFSLGADCWCRGDARRAWGRWRRGKREGRVRVALLPPHHAVHAARCSLGWRDVPVLSHTFPSNLWRTITPAAPCRAAAALLDGHPALAEEFDTLMVAMGAVQPQPL